MELKLHPLTLALGFQTYDNWDRKKVESLRGKIVVILFDEHDEAGARRVASTLKNVASSISLYSYAAISDELDRDFTLRRSPERLLDIITTDAVPAFRETSKEPIVVIEAADYIPPKSCSEYVLDGLLPRGHVVLLSGHGGLGKTTLATTIGALVSCAMPFGSHGCSHTAYVTYVDLENLSEAPLRCLPAIAHAYGLNEVEVRKNFRYLASGGNPQLLSGGRGSTPELVETELFHRVRDAMGSCDLLIVDHIGHAFGGNHNDPTAVYEFLRRFADLANEHDCAVVLIGHIDKDSAKYGAAGNSYSGTAAWHNGVRNRWALVEEDRRVILKHEKCNLAPVSPSIVLARNNDGILLPIGGLSDDGLSDEERDQDDQLVFSAIVAASRVGIHIPTTSTGYKQLLDLQELALYNSSPAGSKRVKLALTRLVRKKLIYKKEIRISGRLSERWVPVQFPEF